MRLKATGLILASAALALGACANTVPPLKGNDTGGIISTSLISQTDIRALAIDHCARYGKVVKFLAVQAFEGGYISFSCRWVPYGAAQQPIRTLY